MSHCLVLFGLRSHFCGSGFSVKNGGLLAGSDDGALPLSAGHTEVKGLRLPVTQHQQRHADAAPARSSLQNSNAAPVPHGHNISMSVGGLVYLSSRIPIEF